MSKSSSRVVDEPSNSQSQGTIADSIDGTGIYVCGTVRSRKRKEVTTKKGQNNVVSYSVMTDEGIIYVDEWDPTTIYGVGCVFIQKIACRAYVSKNGGARVGFTIPRNDTSDF